MITDTIIVVIIGITVITVITTMIIISIIAVVVLSCSSIAHHHDHDRYLHLHHQDGLLGRLGIQQESCRDCVSGPRTHKKKKPELQMQGTSAFAPLGQIFAQGVG